MVVESTTTIAGSCAIGCDAVASRLAERIDSLSLDGPLAEALQNGDFAATSGPARCELEIEVRLGCIKNSRDGQRFALPLVTDALLSERAPVRFHSSVSQAQFRAAAGLLKQAAEVGDSKSRWRSELGVLTFDRFFKLPDYEEAVRISVPQNQTANRGKAFEAIRKVKLLTWNVSTGSAAYQAQLNDDAGETGDQDHLDYRVAVNLEYRVPMSALPNTSAAINRRKKSRNSYSHPDGHLRFDLTEVQTVQSDSGSGGDQPCQYELEAELDGGVVIDTLTREAIPHSERLQLLRYYCATLVRAVKHLRDFVMRGESSADPESSLSSGIMTAKLGLCDLRIVQRGEEEVRKYRKAVSPQLPLIGDYLFRAVTPALERGQVKKQRCSPYREHVVEIPGPYVVVDGGPEQGKQVLLSKRA
ncbi:mRNA capping enzyme, beta chain protein [Babesia caballi]|uniref:mRNA 5'-phosphatase n=1 Tax=Babesia caballi TaxID=5871 RepID=A0AAV4M1U6_BABCB|nr:mRNA capping enzyme, beta chain protein [Babesia caballi]